MVDDGHADGVQTHKAKNYPVEAVGLDHAADGEAQHALFPAQVGSRTPSHSADVHRRPGTTWKTQRANVIPSHHGSWDIIVSKR